MAVAVDRGLRRESGRAGQRVHLPQRGEEGELTYYTYYIIRNTKVRFVHVIKGIQYSDLILLGVYCT